MTIPRLTWAVLLLATPGLLGVTAVASGQQKPGEQPPPIQPGQPNPPGFKLPSGKPGALPPPVPTQGTPLRGTITQLQPGTNQFILRTVDGRTVPLFLGDRTVLRRGNQVIRFADLREGMEVRVLYDVVNQRNVISSLTVGAGADVPGQAVVTVTPVEGQANRFLVRTADNRELILQVGHDVRLIDPKDGTEVIVTFDIRGSKNVVVALGGTRAPGAGATDPGDKPPPAKGVTVVGAGQPVKGTITKVQADAGLVTFRRADGREFLLHVPEGAEIRIDDKDIPLSALKEGKEVIVIYDIKEGKNVVSSIKSVPLTGGQGAPPKP
jgi:Cu/Ag efflux protein CusF